MNHHVPILCNEVVENLVLIPGGIYMDCTVGFGGHSEKILNKLNTDGMLIGMDIDPYALKESNKKLGQHYKNFCLYNCSYIDFPEAIRKNKLKKVDGLLFDLGISSYQVNTAHRGFSYSHDGPLDMRFNPNDNATKTAKDVLSNLSEDEISNYIKDYGEEKNHKRIAKSIINEIQKNKLNTTTDLKNAICKVIPEKHSNKTLSRVFQAIRIVANDEINTLKETLKLSYEYLNKGGRIAIITFHSIEDRIVKHFLKDSTIYKKSSYNIEFKTTDRMFKQITKKPIYPSSDEIKKNPRARSAKLRIAERV